MFICLSGLSSCYFKADVVSNKAPLRLHVNRMKHAIIRKVFLFVCFGGFCLLVCLVFSGIITSVTYWIPRSYLTGVPTGLYKKSLKIGRIGDDNTPPRGWWLGWKCSLHFCCPTPCCGLVGVIQALNVCNTTADDGIPGSVSYHIAVSQGCTGVSAVA